MKRLLLPVLAALALPTAVNAEVDPKVHKLCLPVADYMGCVKAQSGKSNQMRITVDEGVALSEGNATAKLFNFIMEWLKDVTDWFSKEIDAGNIEFNPKNWWFFGNADQKENNNGSSSNNKVDNNGRLPNPADKFLQIP